MHHATAISPFGGRFWVRSRHHCSNLLAHSSSIVTIWCRLRPARRCGVCLTSPCHCRRFQRFGHLVIWCFSLLVISSSGVSAFGHPTYRLPSLLVLQPSDLPDFWLSGVSVISLSDASSLLVLQPSGHLVIRCFSLRSSDLSASQPSGASVFWCFSLPVISLSDVSAFWSSRHSVLQPSGHLVIRCFSLPVFHPSSVSAIWSSRYPMLQPLGASAFWSSRYPMLPASRRFSLLAPCLSVIRPSGSPAFQPSDLPSHFAGLTRFPHPESASCFGSLVFFIRSLS